MIGERVHDEGRLSRSGDPGDDRHDSERHIDIDIAEIIFVRSAHGDLSRWFTSLVIEEDLLFP